MAVRKADAVWEGKLKDGKGKMRSESGKLDSEFNAKTRFDNEAGTNPEELLGAAYAGCFSMALSHLLGEAGYNPKHIHTTAEVHLEAVNNGFEIQLIELNTEGRVPDIDEDTFKKYAAEAKDNCPVSQALTGVKKELKSRLLN
ncbi:MAG: OsmC family protein [Calditrichaceae bacterium]|jgi:lipoyl-dependent peroxiredoxin